LFVIIVIYAYFIDISQVSVETHLRCGGIYNNRLYRRPGVHPSVCPLHSWSVSKRCKLVFYDI